MENVLRELNSKVLKHEEKIRIHKGVEEDLRGEYILLDNGDERKDLIGRKLEITIRAIEYHKGSSKTYRKAYDMIIKEQESLKVV